jgi:hypothetical protein
LLWFTSAGATCACLARAEVESTFLLGVPTGQIYILLLMIGH